MNILEIQSLSKYFKNKIAVDNISFSIPHGVCFGLLGPNGAGKTTTLEMIEGITAPTTGHILFQGVEKNHTFKHHAGIQFQETALPDYLNVDEIITLFSSFYLNPLPKKDLIELCHLSSFKNNYATELSGGQRQRLLLALAILHKPKIIFLDEPTTGLDPHSRRQFWSLLENIKHQGTSILLTTHYMDEAEFLCDELMIMNKGEIIEQGTPERLISKHFNYHYLTLMLQDNEGILNLDPENVKAKSISQQAGRIIIYSFNIAQTLQSLIHHGANLESIHTHPPTLEDLFLKLTGSSLNA
jgi:ABC-2 type transport system ATP-binding protein